MADAHRSVRGVMEMDRTQANVQFYTHKVHKTRMLDSVEMCCMVCVC